MASEKTIQSKILAEIGANPDLRVWRNNTGQAWTGNNVLKATTSTPTAANIYAGDILIRKAHPIKFGLAGSADIIGIQRPTGRFVAIEVKTPTGRQSKQQKLFQEMIESMGGLYIIATNPEKAKQGLLL